MSISTTAAFKEALRNNIDTSQVKVEVNFTGTPAFPGSPVIVGGTWVDITSWTEEASGSQEEVSQLTGGASANTMNLTLNNDDARFSTKYTAGPYFGNLKPNRPMRVNSVVGSESVRIFTGFSGGWPTQAKARIAQVDAQDAARILKRQDIVEETVFNPSAPTTGYYLTKIIERAAYLSGWRWDAVTTKSADWTNLDQNGDGSSEITATYNGSVSRATYTYGGTLVMTLDLVDLLIPVAPLKGKALAVLDQLAKVVDGAIYFDAQGQLVFRSRMYRNDSTLTSVETLTVSSLEDVTAQTNFEDSRWAQIVNRATVRSTPYTFRTDTTGAVIEEEIPFKGDLFGKFYFDPAEEYPTGSDADLYCEIPNGIKLFKTASYPTAANLVLRSVDNADPTKESNSIKFKSGFPVFEQTRIKVAFENTGSAAERIQMLTFRGKLMRPVQKCQSVQRNEASIALYDQRDKEVSNDLIPNAGSCKNLAAWLVEDGREPKTVLTLPVMYGIPWLELGDKITVSETITNTVPASEDFIVRRISWRWSLAAFAFTIEACSPAANFTVSSLPAAVVNVETSNQNNNGVEQGSVPPQIIDGTQGLVGLNNIPAFAGILGRSKLILPTGAGVALGIAFDGSDIFVGDNLFDRIYRVDTMTGATTETKSVSASMVSEIAIGKTAGGASLLFVAATSSKQIRVIDTSVFSSGSFTIKADLTVAGYSPFSVAVAHGKQYVIASKAGEAYLLVWDSVSTTQQDAPDRAIQLSSGGDATSQMAYSSDALFVATWSPEKILKYDPATNTLSDYIALSTGEGVLGLAHDGLQLWATIEDQGIARFRETGGGVARHPEEIPLSSYGYALFDGTYIWIATPGKLIQFSTAGSVIAEYATSGSSSGYMCFDGAAIWQTTGAEAVVRVPRIVSGRQF